MRSIDDVRAALVAGGRVALVVGPLGRARATQSWLQSLGATQVELLEAAGPEVAGFERVVDLRTAPREVVEAWAAEVFPGSTIAAALAPAGQLIEEAVASGIENIDDPRLGALPGYFAYESRLMADGARRFLDFARILALTSPRPVQVGDEWVQLANRLSGSSWSIADLGMVLREYADALAHVTHGDGTESVALASPFIARILASRVKLSTSEHYALFRALREMAVRTLERRDASDRFVAVELPWQALAGDAVEQLCDDGMALLASDPWSLITVIENEKSPVSQGSKLVLRAAHRLDERDTLSQLELAARRGGMVRLADQIAQGTPARQWGPIWATSQPVNTNRVLFSLSANVVCLAADPREPDRTWYAGLTNGEVWRVGRYERARLTWRQSPFPSEVRAMASLQLGEQSLIFTAHSDQGVRALDPDDGTIRWADTSTMSAPLSAIAAATTPSGSVVAAGGVDGILLLVDAASGERLFEPPRLDVEIRDITILSSAVLVALVDGRVAAIDLSDGRTLWWSHIVEGVVCNALAAVETRSGLRAVVGTAAGQVFSLASDDVRAAPISVELTGLGSSVNSMCVFESGGDLTIVAGLADASWVKREAGASSWRRYLGHVGSVNAVLIADGGHIVTAGGEGTVRSWLTRFVDSESATLEWGIRHRGPVTGINIDVGGSRSDVTHITGGADGTLRAWFGPNDTTGIRIAHHDSPVRALIWHPAEETAYVGHNDGVLQMVTRDGDSWTTHLIGIQHDGVRGLTLSPSGRLYSAGVDGTVTRWHSDLGAGGAKTKPVSDFGYVSAVGWLSHALAVGGQDGRVHLLNPISLDTIVTVDLFDAIKTLDAADDEGAAADTFGSITCLAGKDGDLFVGLTTGDIVILTAFDRPAATGIRRLRRHMGEIRGIQCFELSGNLVIATTGLDRRLVLTDMRTEQQLLEVALDGFGLGLHADPPRLAVSTTSGAMMIELSAELPSFVGSVNPLRRDGG